MTALHTNDADWLMIRRADAEFILAALEHFGDWGFRPLDFEHVRQARAVLERGLVTPDGEPVGKRLDTDLKAARPARPGEPGD